MAKSLSNHKWLYNTHKWRKMSKRYRVAHPLCEVCLEYDILTPCDLVDHTIEVEDNPELAWCESNFKAMCMSCHNTKTADEVRKREDKEVNTFGSISDYF